MFLTKTDFKSNASFLSSFLPFLTDIVVFLNNKHEITEFNLAAEQYFEWKKVDVLGKNFIDLCLKNDFEFPLSQTQLKKIELYSDRYQIFTTAISIEAGKKHFASWKIVPLHDEKNTIGLLLIGKDITQEKNAEKRAGNIEKILESIIKPVAGNHWWKDINGVYLGCNDAFLKTLGLNSRTEVIGKTDYELPWADTADVLIKNDHEVMKSGVSQQREEQVTTKTGKILTFMVVKTPLMDGNGAIVGTAGNSIDITEQKKIAKALIEAKEREKIALAQIAEEKANKAQAEIELRQAVMILAGSIAHDLRGPISRLADPGYTIKHYWPILIDAYRQAKDANLPLIGSSIEQWKIDRNLEELEKLPHTFEDATQDMNNFINVTLKTLSKVVQGELAQDDLGLCTTWHCIHNTLLRYPFSSEERNLVHWEQGDDFEFMGNEILMIRVLSNLLTNSLQQIRKNMRGEIFIVLEKGDKINTVRIKDTAGGASPEIVAHLFDGYRTTKKDGTGIGLAFCKITMNSFGGDITCNSVNGNYIEFALTFPQLLRTAS